MSPTPRHRPSAPSPRRAAALGRGLSPLVLLACLLALLPLAAAPTVRAEDEAPAPADGVAAPPPSAAEATAPAAASAAEAPASAEGPPTTEARPTRVRMGEGGVVHGPGGPAPLVTDVLGVPIHDNPPGTPNQETVRQTAIRLGVDPAALQLGVVGLGHVYARQYGDAEALFTQVTRDYPASAVGPFGHVLLYQSWMLENYDFSKELQWLAATAEGIARSEAAIDRGEALAWNEFVRGALMGIDSIYQLRKGQYLSALGNAVKAISSIERSMELDPEFTDPALCMGVYNYWRSVLSDKYWFLPSFGDKRTEGLNQIRLARDHGTFTRPGARLALAYSYLQEGQVDDAKEQCRQLAALYPDNLINNMLLGRIALRERRLRTAKWYFGKVKEVSPENWLVEYYLGLIAMRERRNTDARDHFVEFLAHDGDVSGQAWAHYRLGDVYWQLFMDDAARREWQAALDLESSFKGPQRRLEGSTPKRGDDLPPLRRPGPQRKGKKPPVDKDKQRPSEKMPAPSADPPEDAGEEAPADPPADPPAADEKNAD